MMFETSTMQLSTLVRCNRCGATLEISTDDRRMAQRSASTFQKNHQCRRSHALMKGLIRCEET